MKKYIYQNDDLRCKIKLNQSTGEFRLQVQEHVAWFVWKDVGRELIVSERFWGENLDDINPMVLDVMGGRSHEIYKSNTLDINVRAIDYLREYLKSKQSNNNLINRAISQM